MDGMKGFLLGVGAAAVVSLGVLAMIEARREAAPQEAARAREAPALDQAMPDAAAIIAEAAQPESANPGATAPRFDLVRIEPDGAALVAGSADPGDLVEVLIDSAPVATATADASGAFVATFAMPKLGGIRRLDLMAKGPEGQTPSRDPVFATAPDEDAPDPEPPVVAQAQPEGVRLLQAPQRPPEAPVTLDVLSYSPEGAVVMQGRASPNGLVRIYVGATLVAETQVSPNGDWTAQGAEIIAPGGYTLRVDELGSAGQVVSRIETPFERADAADAALVEGTMVVQPGASLWKLAERVYGKGVRYTVIYDANRERIRDPDLIYPGQILDIPQPASNR